MAGPEGSEDLSALPTAHAQPRSRWSFQVVWLIPLVSALIGGWLAVKAVLERGPTITVSFLSAEGLEAGKTKLKYKDVEIGLVKGVTLAKDLTRVIATAEILKEFTPHLVEDTRFWVVRPRISGGTVSGLNTLLSGSYIAVDIGKSTRSRREFQGLDTPPVVAVDAPGREFILTGDSVGSVDSGSPVFFRRLKVGQVTSYALNEDGKGVTIKVFVNEPYDKYVGTNTRFWSASGLDVTLDANGLKLELESLVSLVLGGIAFETPAESPTFVRAGANTAFRLFPDRSEAMQNPEIDVLRFQLVFNESARGLVPGAPVDFRGLVVGEVVKIKVDVDPKSKQIVIPVEVNIYPDRMRLASRTVVERRSPEARRQFMGELVARGMRAQLRSGSLITGRLYVALDFFPKAAKAEMNWAATPAELPTTPGGRQELQQVLASVAAKLDAFPLVELGNDARTALGGAERLFKRVDTEVTPELRQTLQSATRLLTRVDSEVTPEARAMLVDARKALDSANKLLSAESPLQQDAGEALRELARAAHAFRILADYLERNPQAVLLGKKEQTP